MPRLDLPDPAEPRTDLVGAEDTEPEVLVEGTVPGHVGEGGQRDRGMAVGDGPPASLVQESPSHSPALALGHDTDLF